MTPFFDYCFWKSARHRPDDFVVGFEQRADADRFLSELQERMAKFGLELHPEKTRLIEFGRFAPVDRLPTGRRGTGAVHVSGIYASLRKNSRGNFIVWRQTARKRLEAKLQQIKQTLRKRMHESVPKVGEWLGRVLRGFYQYHAVPGNWRSLKRFRQRIGRCWWHVLSRRSQRGRLDAERIARLANRWLPKPRLVHLYPEVRFAARYLR